MKNTIKILFFVLLLTNCTKEKIEIGGVIDKNVLLTSQKAVNEFALHKYVAINGELIIGGEDIEYLDSLYTLKSVSKSITISNTSLVNTIGLNKIEIIANKISNRSINNLWIYDNPKLEVLNFTELKDLNGGLSIKDNPLLKGIYMPKLSFVEEAFIFENLPKLKDLNFNALKYLGGTLHMKNTGLRTLFGLSSRERMQDTTIISAGSFDAGIEILYNNDMINLQGLQGLNKIGGNLSISNNPNLVDIDALLTVTAITHGIDIWSNSALLNLDGLQNVSSVDAGIVISSNTNLSDLCGLSSCYNNAASFETNNNAYNPTYTDMQNGDCSQ